VSENNESAKPVIRATEFSYYDDCWVYALSDGTITKGRPGDARIPVGLPLTGRMQWGANQLARLDGVA
jgi:hypothetical protein